MRVFQNQNLSVNNLASIKRFNNWDKTKFLIAIYFLAFTCNLLLSNFSFHVYLVQIRWIPIFKTLVTYIICFLPIRILEDSGMILESSTKMRNWLQGISLSGLMLLLMGFESSIQERVLSGMLRLGFLGAIFGFAVSIKLFRIDQRNARCFSIFFAANTFYFVFDYIIKIKNA